MSSKNIIFINLLLITILVATSCNQINTNEQLEITGETTESKEDAEIKNQNPNLPKELQPRNNIIFLIWIIMSQENMFWI